MTERGRLAIEGTDVFDLKSEAVGDSLRITVALPFLYDALQQRFPTVYVLDGNLCLPMASSIARTMQMLAFGVMSPIICVGIGYATDDLLDVLSMRTRDLTPTEAAMPASAGAMAKHGTGGADRLLDALVEEVFPVIEERYRSDAEDRVVAGWSLGGLFALHALFTRPESFARYVAISPSIWWDDRTVLAAEERYAAENSDLAATLFASVGDGEETAPARMWPPVPEGAHGRVEFAQDARMVSNLDELVGRLRGRRYPSLRLVHEVFADEFHSTMFPAAYTRALVTLFGR